MRSEPTLGLILAKLLACLCTIALRIIGIAIGIGLGLGFAIHVRDVLEKLSEEQAKQKETKKEPILSRHNSVISSSSTSTTLQARSLGTTTTTPATGRDSSSYHSLMMDAGYSVPTVVRGQVRATNSTTTTNNTNYHTGNHSGRNNCNRGAQVMKEMFPSLPIDVSNEIGQLVDLIMRDYVASWFSTVDVSVPYTDPAKQLNQPTEENSNNENEQKQDENETCDNSLKRRTMIYTTSDARTAPFMDVMYDFLAFLFGNFGVTAMDRFNVLRFVMIKMVTVLAKTLSVYRTMRDRAVQRRIADQQQLLLLKVQQQQQSTRKEELDSTERVVETPTNKMVSTEGAMKPIEEATTSTTGLRSDIHSSLTCPISEAAVAREFLQAGRLHAAITFGVGA